MADKRQLKSIKSRYDLDVSWHREPWKPLRTQLSYIFAIGSIVACFAWLWGDHTVFESRCVSNAHKHLEQKCSNCHDRSFVPLMRIRWLNNSITSTSDHKCSKCHRESNSDHLLSAKEGDLQKQQNRVAALEKQVTSFSDLHCAECHDEHRGKTALTEVADSLCTDCHIKAHAQLTPPQFSLNFHEFRHHPNFSIWSEPGPAKALMLPKLVDWNAGEPVDQSKLRFSHHRHLDPELPTADRKTTKLECADCHQPDLSGAYFRPINFEQHCHRCHKLGVPSTGELPHSKPEIIHGILLDRLKNESGKAKALPVAADEIGGPTKKPIDAPKIDVNHRPGFDELVGAPLKELEELLFLRTSAEVPESLPRRAGLLEAACTKCHDTEKGKNPNDQWRVLAPNLPEQWLKNGRFRHDRHFSIDCTACHTRRGDSFDPVKRESFYPLLKDDLKKSASIYASVSARDVLMPRIGICQKCHDRSSSLTGSPLVSDNCVDCHAYHHTPPQTRPRAEILDLLKAVHQGRTLEHEKEPISGANR